MTVSSGVCWCSRPFTQLFAHGQVVVRTHTSVSCVGHRHPHDSSTIPLGSQFNHSLLLSWQHWRGEFTRQRRLLNFKSFADLQHRCHSAGKGGHIRAIKTIRMAGELGQLARECIRQHADGNFSCVLIQLVRHPLSTLRSERLPKDKE